MKYGKPTDREPQKREIKGIKKESTGNSDFEKHNK